MTETIGPYRVRELLGKAGQSAVYSAVAPEGRQVAIKLFPRPPERESGRGGALPSRAAGGRPGLPPSQPRAHPGHRPGGGPALSGDGSGRGDLARPPPQAGAAVALRGVHGDAGDLPGTRPGAPARAPPPQPDAAQRPGLPGFRDRQGVGPGGDRFRDGGAEPHRHPGHGGDPAGSALLSGARDGGRLRTRWTPAPTSTPPG